MTRTTLLSDGGMTVNTYPTVCVRFPVWEIVTPTRTFRHAIEWYGTVVPMSVLYVPLLYYTAVAALYVLGGSAMPISGDGLMFPRPRPLPSTLGIFSRETHVASIHWLSVLPYPLPPQPALFGTGFLLRSTKANATSTFVGRNSTVDVFECSLRRIRCIRIVCGPNNKLRLRVHYYSGEAGEQPQPLLSLVSAPPVGA